MHHYAPGAQWCKGGAKRSDTIVHPLHSETLVVHDGRAPFPRRGVRKVIMCFLSSVCWVFFFI